MASTKTTLSTTGMMFADYDSFLQRQIALIGILQTTVKKIFLSLFTFLQFLFGCTLTVLHETFVWAFYLRYRADFFTGDVTNSGLNAAFFTFLIPGVPYSYGTCLTS